MVRKAGRRQPFLQDAGPHPRLVSGPDPVPASVRRGLCLGQATRHWVQDEEAHGLLGPEKGTQVSGKNFIKVAAQRAGL